MDTKEGTVPLTSTNVTTIRVTHTALVSTLTAHSDVNVKTDTHRATSPYAKVSTEAVGSTVTIV